MKKLLGILVLGLFLITPSWADDIRDFQIEGISIGDSLLDFMNESEIKNKSNEIHYYKSRKYVYYFYPSLDFLKTYDALQVTVKGNDKDYKIYGLDGVINFRNDINSCHKKQNEINMLFNATKNKKDENTIYLVKQNMIGMSPKINDFIKSKKFILEGTNKEIKYTDGPLIEALKKKQDLEKYNYALFRNENDTLKKTIDLFVSSNEETQNLFKENEKKCQRATKNLIKKNFFSLKKIGNC